MIVMGSVVFRAERDPERIAGRRLYLTQKARLVIVALPVSRNGDPRAVLQAKASQIQRIGRRVLAAPVAARDVATGVAAEVVDPCNRLAEHLPRSTT